MCVAVAPVRRGAGSGDSGEGQRSTPLLRGQIVDYDKIGDGVGDDGRRSRLKMDRRLIATLGDEKATRRQRSLTKSFERDEIVARRINKLMASAIPIGWNLYYLLTEVDGYLISIFCSNEVSFFFAVLACCGRSINIRV